jgi:hypothetical protein
MAAGVAFVRLTPLATLGRITVSQPLWRTK